MSQCLLINRLKVKFPRYMEILFTRISGRYAPKFKLLQRRFFSLRSQTLGAPCPAGGFAPSIVRFNQQQPISSQQKFVNQILFFFGRIFFLSNIFGRAFVWLIVFFSVGHFFGHNFFWSLFF